MKRPSETVRRPRVEPLEHERPHDYDADSAQRVGFGSDSNDETDAQPDEWNNDDQFERDLYGRGRFDR